ncbi:RING-type E3 ubiquitin transferase [Trifolium repens]|nr:RING-type E3 ubiquitin transferase [Trifolium repens]
MQVDRMGEFYARSEKIAKLMSCNQLLTDATKILNCFHTFCKECIYTQIREEELECCPIEDEFMLDTDTRSTHTCM